MLTAGEAAAAVTATTDAVGAGDAANFVSEGTTAIATTLAVVASVNGALADEPSKTCSAAVTGAPDGATNAVESAGHTLSISTAEINDVPVDLLDEWRRSKSHP